MKIDFKKCAPLPSFWHKIGFYLFGKRVEGRDGVVTSRALFWRGKFYITSIKTDFERS